MKLVRIGLHLLDANGLFETWRFYPILRRNEKSGGDRSGRGRNVSSSIRTFQASTLSLKTGYHLVDTYLPDTWLLLYWLREILRL